MSNRKKTKKSLQSIIVFFLIFAQTFTHATPILAEVIYHNDTEYYDILLDEPEEEHLEEEYLEDKQLKEESSEEEISEEEAAEEEYLEEEIIDNSDASLSVQIFIGNNSPRSGERISVNVTTEFNNPMVDEPVTIKIPIPIANLLIEDFIGEDTRPVENGPRIFTAYSAIGNTYVHYRLYGEDDTRDRYIKFDISSGMRVSTNFTFMFINGITVNETVDIVPETNYNGNSELIGITLDVLSEFEWNIVEQTASTLTTTVDGYSGTLTDDILYQIRAVSLNRESTGTIFTSNYTALVTLEFPPGVYTLGSEGTTAYTWLNMNNEPVISIDNQFVNITPIFADSRVVGFDIELTKVNESTSSEIDSLDLFITLYGTNLNVDIQEFNINSDGYIISNVEFTATPFVGDDIASSNSSVHVNIEEINTNIVARIESPTEDLVSLGEYIVYQIIVENTGFGREIVEIENIIPIGTDFVSAGQGGVLFDDTVRWEVELNGNVTEVLTLVVQVRNDVLDGFTISNRARVNGVYTAFITHDTPISLLEFEKTSNRTDEIVRAGESITYTITITNTGDGHGLARIINPIPIGTEFIDNTSNNPNYGVLEEGRLYWNITVPANSEIEVSFTVVVREDVSNGFTISSSAIANGQGINIIEVRTPNSNESISLTAVTENNFGESQVRLGEIITYTITLTNEAEGNAQVDIRNVLPEGVTFLGVLEGTEAPEQSSSQLLWENVFVPANSGFDGIEPVKFVFNVVVNSVEGVVLSDGERIENRIILNNSGRETFSNTVTHYVIAPRVEFDIEANPMFDTYVNTGDIITYSIIARNVGSDAALANISIIVPERTTFIPGSITLDGMQVSDTVLNDGEIHYTTNVGGNGQAVLSFQVAVGEVFNGNRLEITGTVNELPTQTGFHDTPLPQLESFMMAVDREDGSTVFVNDEITYRIIVENRGNGNGTARITSIVPMGTTFTDNPINNPNGGTVLTHTIVWNDIMVPAGEYIEVFFTVTVDSDVVNGFEIGTFSVVNENSTNRVDLYLPIALVAIEKSATTQYNLPWVVDMAGWAQPVRLNEIITYTITLTNEGLGNGMVRVVDPLPVGVSFVGIVSGPEPIITQENQNITLTWEDIFVPAGAGIEEGIDAVELIFEVRLDPNTVEIGDVEEILNFAVLVDVQDDRNDVFSNTVRHTVIRPIFYFDLSADPENQTSIEVGIGVEQGDIITYYIEVGNRGHDSGTTTAYGIIPPLTMFVPGSVRIDGELVEYSRITNMLLVDVSVEALSKAIISFDVEVGRVHDGFRVEFTAWLRNLRTQTIFHYTPIPHIMIEKDAMEPHPHLSYVHAGDIIEYRIILTAAHSGSVVTVRDVLPRGVLFEDYSVVVSDGVNEHPLSGYSISVVGNTVTLRDVELWRNTPINPFQTIITIYACVLNPPHDFFELRNVATATSVMRSLYGTLVTMEIISNEVIHTALRKNIVSEKTSSLNGPIEAGDIITYNIRVANQGMRRVTGINIIDIVPRGTTYIPGTATGGDDFFNNNGFFLWVVGLDPGEYVIKSFQVVVDEGLTEGFSITNMAIVDTSPGLPGDWCPESSSNCTIGGGGGWWGWTWGPGGYWVWGWNSGGGGSWRWSGWSSGGSGGWSSGGGGSYWWWIDSGRGWGYWSGGGGEGGRWFVNDRGEREYVREGIVISPNPPATRSFVSAIIYSDVPYDGTPESKRINITPQTAAPVANGEPIEYFIKLTLNEQAPVGHTSVINVRSFVPLGTRFIEGSISHSGINYGRNINWNNISVTQGIPVILSFTVSVDGDYGDLIRNHAIVGSTNTNGVYHRISQLQIVGSKYVSVDGGETFHQTKWDGLDPIDERLEIGMGGYVYYKIKLGNLAPAGGRALVVDQITSLLNIDEVSLIASGGEIRLEECPYNEGNIITWAEWRNVFVPANTPLDSPNTVNLIFRASLAGNPEEGQQVPNHALFSNPFLESNEMAGMGRTNQVNVYVKRTIFRASQSSDPIGIPQGAQVSNDLEEGRVLPGMEIEYTIEVRNIGRDGGYIEIVNPIPVGTNFVTASGDFIISDDNEIIWNNVHIPAGGEATVTFIVVVRDDIANGSRIDNHPTMAEINVEFPYHALVTPAVITHFTPLAEIIGRLESDVEYGVNVIPEQYITFTITAENVGLIRGFTTIRNQLPLNTVFISADGDIIPNENGELIWPDVYVPAGGIVTKMFTVRVDYYIANGATVENFAVVAGENTNRIVHETDPPSIVAEMLVSIDGGETFTVANLDVELGYEVIYKIRIANYGLGRGLVRLENEISTLLGNITEISNGGVFANRTIIWQNINVPAGITFDNAIELTFRATVVGNPMQGQLIPNMAIYDNAQIEGSHQTGMAQTNTVNLVVQRDVIGSMQVSNPEPGVILPGEYITYTITVDNTGGAARNVEVRNPIPAGTTFVEASGGELIGNTVIWPLTTISPGEEVTKTITIRVNETIANGTIINNSPTVDGMAVTPTTISHRIPLADITGLMISSRGGNDIPVGENINYVISLTNHADVNGQITVTSQIPAGTELDIDSIIGNGTFNPSLGLITWANVPVSRNSTVELGFTVSVMSTTPHGTMINAQARLGTVDTNMVSNRALAPVFEGSVSVVSNIDYSGSTTLGHEILSYTIRVANTGGVAGLVNITNQIPVGTRYVASSATNGGYLNNLGVLNWSLNLRAGEERLLQFEVIVEPLNEGTLLRNIVFINGIPTNEVITRVLGPSLNVTLSEISHMSPTISVGNRLEYAITLQNSGSIPVTLNVSNVIPEGTTFIGFTGIEGSFNANLHTVRWDNVVVEPGVEIALTFEVVVTGLTRLGLLLPRGRNIRNTAMIRNNHTGMNSNTNAVNHSFRPVEIFPGIRLEAIGYRRALTGESVNNLRGIDGRDGIRWQTTILNDGRTANSTPEAMEDYAVVLILPFLHFYRSSTAIMEITSVNGERRTAQLPQPTIETTLHSGSGYDTITWQLNGSEFALPLGATATISFYSETRNNQGGFGIRSATAYVLPSTDQSFNPNAVSVGRISNFDGRAGVTASTSVFVVGGYITNTSISATNLNNGLQVGEDDQSNILLSLTEDTIVYYLALQNGSTMHSFEGLSLIGRMPHIDDSAVMNTNISRGSAFDVEVTGVRAVRIDGEIIDPSMYTIAFSNIMGDFSLADWAGTSVWNTPMSEAVSYRILFDRTLRLAPGSEIVIELEARMPEDALAGTIAWKSFAFNYRPIGMPTDLQVESAAIGLELAGFNVTKEITGQYDGSEFNVYIEGRFSDNPNITETRAITFTREDIENGLIKRVPNIVIGQRYTIRSGNNINYTSHVDEPSVLIVAGERINALQLVTATSTRREGFLNVTSEFEGLEFGSEFIVDVTGLFSNGLGTKRINLTQADRESRTIFSQSNLMDLPGQSLGEILAGEEYTITVTTPSRVYEITYSNDGKIIAMADEETASTLTIFILSERTNDLETEVRTGALLYEEDIDEIRVTTSDELRRALGAVGDASDIAFNTLPQSLSNGTTVIRILNDITINQTIHVVDPGEGNHRNIILVAEGVARLIVNGNHSHFQVNERTTLRIADEGLHIVGRNLNSDLRARYGGGIDVRAGGELILTAGTIRDIRGPLSSNSIHARSFASFAMESGIRNIRSLWLSNAVHVRNYGSFIMNGGVIENNSSNFGGGVTLSGANARFERNGGTIRNWNETN